jgi:methionine-rich copper-binding protein CopC
MHRAVRILLLASLSLMVVPSRSVLAHAIILQATPAPNAAISGPDAEVELRFNSRIDARRSRLALVSNGKERTVAIQESAAPDRLVAQLQDLMPGAYKLKWQVLSVDGHITRGEIPFRVQAN